MRKLGFLVFIIICFLLFAGETLAEPADFNIDGVYETALDLPRILFLLKQEPDGPPLEYMGSFELNWAFLDTGTSGIMMSRETAEIMGIEIESEAQFIDTGITGEEYFDVSEPLYMGTADYKAPHPYNPDIYSLVGPWRFQVKQTYADLFPVDVLGMPVMEGKTAVLDSGATNELEYFSADIKEPNDLTIPQADFMLALRFEKFFFPEDSRNTPPLPVQAYNPVIDNITVEYNGISSTGSWLFDTGAMISIISVAQGFQLGLIDENGDPVITPDFYVPISGIGGQVNIPGFQIDNLIIPTLYGYNLVFNNARIGVHDVGVFDETRDELIILDGVFGSNFLCATMNLNTWEIRETPFDRIVIDTQNGLLGFDVNDAYPLPNSKPWYGSIEDKIIDEGELLQFTVSASDPDGDVLTYSAANLPPGASFDAQTKTFSWTPTYLQEGDYQVTFRVIDDKGAFDEETITISVINGRELPGDVNGDCKVNILDLVYVRNHLSQDPKSSPEAGRSDVNSDGKINILDLVFARNHLGTSCK